MERRRRLADLLAVAAGELLPDRLDLLPLARHHFQRPRHVGAEQTRCDSPKWQQPQSSSLSPRFAAANSVADSASRLHAAEEAKTVVAVRTSMPEPP